MIPRPALSVVIPVFNRERLLAQAIESVLPQLQGGDEIIVVDDGSTDGSAAIARRYPSVSVEMLSENRGAAAAINHGVRKARGEWLAFLDSDDLAAPDRFARQAAHLLAEDAPDIVSGSQWRFAGEDQPNVPSPIPGDQIEHGPTIPTLLLSRATFLAVGFLDESLRIGYLMPWYARVGELGLKIHHDPAIVLWRRAHSGEHLSQECARITDHARALKQILDRRRAAASATHGQSASA